MANSSGWEKWGSVDLYETDWDRVDLDTGTLMLRLATHKACPAKICGPRTWLPAPLEIA
jgi:hypothetical protein